MKRSLVETAASLLAADAESAAAPSAAAKKATVLAMAAAMRARRTRRAAWIAGVALAASVAAAGTVVLVTRHVRATSSLATVSTTAAPRAPSETAALGTVVAAEGAATRVNAGGSVALVPGVTVSASDRVVAPEGASTTLGLFRGTRLVLDERSELAFTSPGPGYVFDLAAGAVRADVAKLAPDERFVVRTTDAEVEVRGTSFRVGRAAPSATCGGGTTTRVVVYEGIVAVRAKGVETLVHPGERWPSDCDAAPLGSIAAPPPSHGATRLANAAATTTASPATVAATKAPVESPPLPASDLAAQNDLFAQAVAKKRAGDARGAVRSLDELLARFPATHLAQSARADRMKLLQTFDPEAARGAARDYLGRYPNGFARSDAEIILRAE